MNEHIATITQPAASSSRHATSQDALSAALRLAGVGVVTRDRHGKITEANAVFINLVGRPHSEVLGTCDVHLMHPVDGLRFAELYRANLATGSSFEAEIRYLTPANVVVWCVTHSSFARDGIGRVTSSVMVVRDVTSDRLATVSFSETEEDARYVIELSPQINWTATPDGMIERVNPRWAEITGADLCTALGEQWIEKLHPDDVANATAAWMASVKTKVPVDIEYRLSTHDGGHRWVRARASARLDEQGDVVRWYGTLEDINDRKLTEHALRDSEERFRLAAQAAGIGIWDYNALDDRREWSDEFKAMLGLPADAASAVATALACVVPDDRHNLQALISAVEAGDSGHRFETMVRIRRSDTGEERWMKTGGWRIEAPSGKLGRVLVTIRDVTEERTVEERIRWTASHDAMTGLPNRAAFGEKLEQAIARATYSETNVALALFDVDHLKETNDTIGHDAGDRLLQTAADRLRLAFGERCTLARLGGDEFAGIFEASDDLDMSAQVQAALEALREAFTHDGRILDCQSTAGGSVFPIHGTTAAELLKSADIALYAAKARHRGGLLTFKPEMRADLQRRSSMISIARDAAREDRIIPYYQPKVVLGSNRIFGFEALLRWHSPQLGLQLPGTIAAAFEDLDLAIAMSERMLTQIVEDMRRWLDEGVDFGRIAVNLSPAEFRQDALVPRILDRLHKSGVPTSRLELEVTETVFLGRDAETVAHALEAFSQAGIKIALDDFGTGFASLTHLKTFPVDVIKIDRSFVSNLDGDAGDAAIVDAVVGLGRRLGMEVVAEGVETSVQAQYLRDCGCEYGQGYLFGKAAPAIMVKDMLQNARN
ncbi:EAL domain-containing protein [Sphingomonas sp. BT553]|uniref:EAL domain-containing protein n=1 Tax=Sphingomonas mollis TaxID=2795726 RepID=A0ABS0XUQ1_9SPHN|nr:GGDEF domain-containing phosphodiesterase [Sphingomonas sp. BT553]MBJ6123771.1 EAL domain-containing protein [Sphingomonas sp. BT553]